MLERNSPAVILVRPSEPGNIGSTARAMANTGLERLIIVEPAAPIDRTARAFAVGAGHILDGAVRAPSFREATAPFQRLVGTSSQRARTPKAEILAPRELGHRIADEPKVRTALVFGPERSGLTTEELARCSPIVQIPAVLRQPTLNLAQAVLILGYEIFIASREVAESRDVGDLAAAGQIEGLLSHTRELLIEIGFARDDTFPAVFRDLRRLVGRAALTSREVQILRGMLRRASRRLSGPHSHE